MSYEAYAHPAQAAILRHLLFSEQASFAHLQKATMLTSDHATFHIKKLLAEGYVTKVDGCYTLTRQGKEYANRMDTDDSSIERQPKISVVVLVERRSATGEREFLFQERRKQPYFGFWGLPQGKMRWGETVAETAVRELKEETGLDATPEYRLLYHVRDYEKATTRLLEDKLFLCAYATEYDGELLEEFEGGHNAWMTKAAFQAKERRFENVDDIMDLIERGVSFVERDLYYDGKEY